jgi:trafficking protein particle complex subunit 4
MFWAITSTKAEVYTLYADSVMKNPFYELDMPIKCDLWEAQLRIAVEKQNRVSAMS